MDDLTPISPEKERTEEVKAETKDAPGLRQKLKILFDQAPYTLALVLLIATIFSLSFLGTNRWGNLFAIAMSMCSFLVVHAAGHNQSQIDWKKSFAICLLVFTAFFALLEPGTRSQLFAVGLLLAIAEFGSIVLTASALKRTRTMGFQPMFGAVSIYLMLGLLFSGLFMLLTGIVNEPILSNAGELRVPDYVYFTFITMMSVGYGDIVPVTEPARMLAVVTGLAGQVYLVTVVATIVGKMSSSK